MTESLPILLNKIDVLKQEIEALRPISSENMNRIMQKFRLDWNFHSNHIEGNKLTYGETKTFILYGLTASGKPLKDHLDIKGHNEAVLWLDDIIKEERPLNETFIREINQMLLGEPFYKDSITQEGLVAKRKITPGQYKSQPNHVLTQTGEIFYFASPEETPAKMNDLLVWYKVVNEDNQIPAAVVAALLHYKFIRIHPFDDGNGRTARILMNLVLMQNGLPPVVIKTEKKEEYYVALKKADGGDENFFIEYIANQLIQSMELFLKGAKGESIEEQDDIDKEIALLKQSLSVEKEKVALTSENKDRLIETFITPFLIMAEKELSVFDEMFLDKKILLLDNDNVNLSNNQSLENTLNHIEDVVNIIKTKIVDPILSSIRIFKLNIDWQDFKKLTKAFFDYKLEITFDFKKFNFEISIQGTYSKSTFYYSEEVNLEKYQSIIQVIKKDFLNFIKTQIEKAKSEGGANDLPF